MEDVKKFIFGFVNKEIKGEEREVFRPSKMDNRFGELRWLFVRCVIVCWLFGWWEDELLLFTISSSTILPSHKLPSHNLPSHLIISQLTIFQLTISSLMCDRDMEYGWRFVTRAHTHNFKVKMVDVYLSHHLPSQYLSHQSTMS